MALLAAIIDGSFKAFAMGTRLLLLNALVGRYVSPSLGANCIQ